MSKVHEVEYCHLDLRFDRRQIRQLIKSLIHEGFSLYWNESDQYFIISVRTGRKLVKLKFQRLNDQYKILGNYSIKDEKLASLIEKMIGDTRGHAVVKRFGDRQILVDNFMFGEIIRKVEISGVEQKVIYQREPVITTEHVMEALKSKRAEERIPVWRMELDYELSSLYDAIQEGDLGKQKLIRERLEKLRKEMVTLEI